MEEKRNKDLREKMSEAVERWCDYMDRDQCIEKMIDEIDSIKKRNEAHQMEGFAFRLNKGTKNFYVVPMWEGETNPNFGEENNPLGRCSTCVFFEVKDLWNDFTEWIAIEEEEENLLTVKVEFI